MATQPFTIQSIQLATAEAAVLTSPSGFYTTTKKVTVANVTTSAATLTMHKVPSGGTPDATNMIIDALNVPPNTIAGGALEIFVAENLTLNPGDTLQTKAGTATAININISGIQQTI